MNLTLEDMHVDITLQLLHTNMSSAQNGSLCLPDLSGTKTCRTQDTLTFWMRKLLVSYAAA